MVGLWREVSGAKNVLADVPIGRKRCESTTIEFYRKRRVFSSLWKGPVDKERLYLQ